MIGAIKNLLQKKTVSTPAAEAYDLWSDSYDVQPGNLMLDLDEIIFSGFIADISLKNKTVADIGCGTGRHWQKIYAGLPAILEGFDVSEGMLRQLKLKFPSAVITHITDDRLTGTRDASFDCVVSTLTIAHIKDLEEAIATWARISKPGADLIITDFHPEMLAKGGRRTFCHGNKQMAVTNFVHSLNKIKTVCKEHGLTVVKQEEKFIDDSVRRYYEKQDAMHVFNQFKGMPVIYGMHLKKQHDTE